MIQELVCEKKSKPAKCMSDYDRITDIVIQLNQLNIEMKLALLQEK